MSKKLNLSYEWIGPRGPLTNKRVPTIYDYANSQTECEVNSAYITGIKPLYYEITQSLPTTNLIKLVSPCEITNDTKFIYEIELVAGSPEFDSFFIPGAGVLDRTTINDKVLGGIKNGNGYLCISTIYESFLEDSFLQQIHNYFETNNIPLNKIIYLTNCINGTEVYESYCQRQGIQPLVNIEYAGVWMKSLHNQSGSSELTNIKYNVELKSKMFLQFNRRYRPQRVIFLMNLYKRNLLKDFYISFSDTQPESNRLFFDVANDLNNRHNIGLTVDELNQLSSQLPLVLDTPDFSKFPMETSLSDTTKFYNDSLIHVIAETNYYTNIIHITEKTLKPIMYKQPFIFVGPPHSLKYLKKFGFMTFSKFWDESYDDEEDHDKRMIMVLDLLEKLNKLSDNEKLAISEQCSVIMKYNFMLLRRLKWDELDNLVEKYGE